ncbi:MAG: acyl-phosphate glycerol 3-phosphate acyltransferase [Planctomycetes bacterium RBG_19FT_COMBO_48_8]|nr:MAG: acyl-phosphate glycerol 3-phosphate acyltransferase [Planctomycetes bacterium RBG_19FT_COMBO_48_8]
MTQVFFPLAIITAYLLGSIPFGLLIAKAHGKDIRSIGSGNIGATNVSRALGRKWAYFCFVLDVLKGLIPMLATMLITEPDSVLTLWLWLAVGCAAILGHIFPIYVKFKGGKGVATSFGVAMGLWPYLTVCALFFAVTWVVVVLMWRYVSLASIVASVTFPLVLIAAIILTPDWDFANLWPVLITSIAIPLMVIVRHRENVKRLLAGTESKIRQKKDS